MTENSFAPCFDDMRLVGEYASHGARLYPDRMAIVADTGALSYAELDQASDRFATHLINLECKPGTRIAYLGPNSELMFPALFGCIRAGCVFVPINWRYSVAEVAFVVSDAEAALLIYGPEVADTAREAAAKLSDSLVLMSTIECRGESPSLRAVLTRESTILTALSVDPGDCVLQLYTSGTTGKPKGVMLSHRAISISRWVEMGAPEWRDWSDEDVILSGMPNFHAGGLGWMLIGLLRSLTCILTADPSAGNLLALSQRYGVTRTFIVPSVLRMLLDAVDASGQAAPSFKTIFYGAAPMDAALITRCMEVFGECGFAQYYGMTEAAGAVTFFAPSDHDLAHPERLRSVGRALPDYRVQVRDANGHPLPPGQPGELWVQSQTLMLGYWKLPEATREVLVDGWYRTGDGAYLDGDGFVFLTDRIKDMIISGGENIYPVEVEQALRLHPAIQDVVVIGVRDEKWGEAVCAVVEWRPGRTATLEELRAFAREHIAGYKLPRVLKSVPMLPRTATGKLQRAEARKQVQAAV